VLKLLRHHPRKDRIAQLAQVFKAPFGAKAVEASGRMLKHAFAKMGSTLERHSWLGGDSYSLADIAAAPVIDRGKARDGRSLGRSSSVRELARSPDRPARLPASAATGRVPRAKAPGGLTPSVHPVLA